MSFRKIKLILKPSYLKIYDILGRIYFYNYILKNAELFKRNNQLCSTLMGENILIFAPHIDDDMIGCGGAIIKYLSTNKNVSICYLTDSGGLGSKSSRTDIIKERRNEALTIASLIGLRKDSLFFLNGEDGNLYESDIEDDIKDVIKLVKPDTIFMPCLLDTHKDHYTVSVKLCKLYKKFVKFFNGITIYLYESQSPITEFYSNICLNITEVISNKIQITKVYKSQPSDFRFMINQNMINGATFGKGKFVEIYIKTNMENYSAFFSKYYSDLEKYLKVREKLIPNGDSRDLIASYKTSKENKTLLTKLEKIQITKFISNL